MKEFYLSRKQFQSFSFNVFFSQRYTQKLTVDFMSIHIFHNNLFFEFLVNLDFINAYFVGKEFMFCSVLGDIHHISQKSSVIEVPRAVIPISS